MKEFKNTKGSWGYSEQPVKSLGFYIHQEGFREPDRAFIGEVGGGLQSEEEILANAKLISASPELLQALINLNHAIDKYWNADIKTERHINSITEAQRYSWDIIQKATV